MHVFVCSEPRCQVLTAANSYLVRAEETVQTGVSHLFALKATGACSREGKQISLKWHLGNLKNLHGSLSAE